MEELDEDNSSFEVIEEEVSSTEVSDLPRDTLPMEPSTDQLCGSCFYVDHVNPEKKDEESILDSVCTSVVQEKDGNSGLPEESDQSNVSHSQCILNYLKRRQEQLSVVKNLPVAYINEPMEHMDVPNAFLHQKHMTILTALFGITLALLWTTFRYSFQISQLQDELTRMKLQHADELVQLSKGQRGDHESTMKNLLAELEQERQLLHELRLHSEGRLNREDQSEKLLVELQRDRDRLIDELRAQSERHAAREAETSNTILELQSERYRLMDALEKATSCHKSGRKTDWSRESLFKNFRNLKKNFRAMGKIPESIPGMDYVQRFLCQIPHLCDEV